MKSDFSFALSRRFLPLFSTQFLGAMNDNFFKTAVFVLISYHQFGNQGRIGSAQWLNIGLLLFILPYFLFSAISGQISTRCDKALIARFVKVMEVLIMSIALFGFLSNSLIIELTCLFLMGTHSTLFGPLKYAILPDYLSEKELVLGNGLIEGGTFIAILFGQFIASTLVGMNIWILGVSLLFAAIIGMFCSFYMPKVAPKNPQETIQINIWKSSRTLLAEAFSEKAIGTAIIGISWFWFLGSIYTTQLLTFTEIHLGANQNVFNLMITLFSIGIGTGSIVCAKSCHGKLSLKWVIWGAIGMSIFGLALSMMTFRQHEVGALIGLIDFLHSKMAYPIILCIVMLGFFGGFFSVPL